MGYQVSHDTSPASLLNHSRSILQPTLFSFLNTQCTLCHKLCCISACKGSHGLLLSILQVLAQMPPLWRGLASYVSLVILLLNFLLVLFIVHNKFVIILFVCLLILICFSLPAQYVNSMRTETITLEQVLLSVSYTQ